jgi:hypothetical protein
VSLPGLFGQGFIVFPFFTMLNRNLLAYEQGELSEEETIVLFQELIDNGMAWHLQGSYGRTAHALIQAGLCMLGPTSARDYYGNYVPSRFEVVAGAPGSEEYCVRKASERSNP